MREAEKQINEQNEKFRNGESTFYEELNKHSDLTKEQFEKEKEGAKFPVTREGRGLGAILPPESEWYTSPELEELYKSRQNVPNSFDATAKGIASAKIVTQLGKIHNKTFHICVCFGPISIDSYVFTIIKKCVFIYFFLLLLQDWSLPLGIRCPVDPALPLPPLELTKLACCSQEPE